MTQFSVTRGEKDLELEVSWVYEESEYGDGSLDEEFETMAYCGSEEILLTEAEETRLKEQLEAEGELA
jgi:hypothetical protein